MSGLDWWKYPTIKGFERIHDEISRTVSSSFLYKEFNRNRLQRESVSLMNAKEENPNFAAKKKLFINPISDTDQREIADRKIFKILVRCFLPTSRLMMAGTAEY